ncbi:hypothetical protein NPIL_602251 [Nephila pilipes]|uniref:Uncharacterized protein n=1 Tax=Nephila pilipes TaxID=299642 RepID=A0A8X6NI02_NEPPI|nr:hypothetical protein NPIL_602251 [Nephila pilipes]
MERDLLKTKEIEWKTKENEGEMEKDVLKTERDTTRTECDELDLPAPISPLPPTPVSTPRRMSPSAESVASPEPCSTEPTLASLRPGPSVVESTVTSVVQRGTDPQRKQSGSKEEKKYSNRSRTNDGKSTCRHISSDARPRDPRSHAQVAKPRDLRSHTKDSNLRDC